MIILGFASQELKDETKKIQAGWSEELRRDRMVVTQGYIPTNECEVHHSRVVIYHDFIRCLNGTVRIIGSLYLEERE